jgi:hypothetical protein
MSVSEPTDEPVVLVEDVGPVRRLTMNRPDALNALNGELIDGLAGAVAAAGADDDVRVVIVRGAGRAFCAGYDLNEDAEGGEHDARHWHAELAQSTARMLELTDCPKPTIAQVHSYCLAGGTDLMLACDLAVVADDAQPALLHRAQVWAAREKDDVRVDARELRADVAADRARAGDDDPHQGFSAYTFATAPRWIFPVAVRGIASVMKICFGRLNSASRSRQ